MFILCGTVAALIITAAEILFFCRKSVFSSAGDD